MKKYLDRIYRNLLAGLALVVLSACSRSAAAQPDFNYQPVPEAAPTEQAAIPIEIAPPIPTRSVYEPGQLVDYTVQSGDNLPALAIRFNTSEDEIRAANPIIPQDATTLPPGMPMQIPIYYLPFWGSAHQIIPDSLYPNGPAQVNFNTDEFLLNQTGWLRYYTEYASGATRSGGAIVELVAENFSVSPRLLLALLEYHSGALSQPTIDPSRQVYPLGYVEHRHKGVYLQLVWAANTLNNGYYGWRDGSLTELDLNDGHQERIDPWQNAASAGLHYYFSQLLPAEQYQQAISPEGLSQVYRSYFGDPWPDQQPHIAGSLHQPTFQLPFEAGQTWAFTGGPHTGWGLGAPFAAVDFAPPGVKGCADTDLWVRAMAPGVVVRLDTGVVVLDLDVDGVPADGDERTGWVLFHLHISSREKVALGAHLNTGDPIGHPSCEGGSSTGTHVHIARKYNGEWVLAEGPLAFNFDGWVCQNGSRPYLGTLTRYGEIVRACTCSDKDSHITAEEH